MRIRSWIVENNWTCPSCGHANRGRDITCQNCGARKDAKVKDSVPDPETAPVVVDPELLKLANDAPNWRCEYCSGQERNAKGECTNCAGERPKLADLQNAFRNVVIDRTPNVGRPVEPPEIVEDRPPLAVEPERSACSECSERKSDGQRSLGFLWRERWWGLGACGVGALIWFLVWLFLPREVDTRVASTTWRYTSELQQRETRHDASWDSDMHAGAFNTSCVTMQHGTHSCDPYTCNTHQESYSCGGHSCNCRTTCSNRGNGFSSCSESCSTCYDTCYRTVSDTCYHQCPTYDQWCEYDYYAWPTILTRDTHGNAKDVTWPDMPTPGALQRIVKHESYTVVFEHANAHWTTNPASLAEYRRFTYGSRWRIKVNHAGSVKPLTEIP
jgi:hypothetical protein